MTTSILIMNLDDNWSIFFPPPAPSKCQPGGLLTPSRCTGTELLWTRKRLAFSYSFILIQLCHREMNEQAWDQKFCPVQSGLFGAKVLHPRSNHSPLSFPPAFLWGTLSADWNVFPSLMQTGALWFSRVMGCAAVRACGWKYLIWIMTLLWFLWTLITSMHILQSGHVEVQVSQKLQYKSWLYGVFYCLCNAQVVIWGRCYFWMRKTLKYILCSFLTSLQNPPNEAGSLLTLANCLLFTLTFFSLWIPTVHSLHLPLTVSFVSSELLLTRVIHSHLKFSLTAKYE